MIWFLPGHNFKAPPYYFSWLVFKLQCFLEDLFAMDVAFMKYEISSSPTVSSTTAKLPDFKDPSVQPSLSSQAHPAQKVADSVSAHIPGDSREQFVTNTRGIYVSNMRLASAERTKPTTAGTSCPICLMA